MYDTKKSDCPRGFKREKDKCVPEGSDVSDKLVLKYERYFFKEGEEMTNTCDDGLRWCPIQKKCVPEADDKNKGKGQGKGKGPIGQPTKVKEAFNLVDIAFDEGFEIFSKTVKAEKEVERILDAIDKVDFGKDTIPTSGRPYDHPKKTKVVADVEECGMMGGGPMNKGMSGGEVDMDNDEAGFDAEKDQAPEKSDDSRKLSNDINQVPNQNVKGLYQSIRSQMSEFALMGEADKSNYKAYFASMLKKFGASSPNDLDTEKKKAFFNAVDKGWKGKNESD